jgi:hypothetical protein
VRYADAVSPSDPYRGREADDPDEGRLLLALSQRIRVQRLRTLTSDRALAADLLRIAGLSPELLSTARVGAEMVPSDLEPQPGQSRLGGRPDLPRGTAWPERADGRSLVFMAQVRLRELPAQVLLERTPDRMISFFYDLEEAPSGQGKEDADAFVVRMDPVQGLVRLEPPLVTERGGAVQFAPILTLPGIGSPHTDELGFGERWRWGAVVEAFVGRAAYHRFLGHPDPQASSVEAACARMGRDARSRAKPWRSLLELVEEPARRWFLGGSLHVCVPEGDLELGRGEDAWAMRHRTR